MPSLTDSCEFSVSVFSKLTFGPMSYAHNPRFVETLARRGYHFIAQVENGNRGRLASSEEGEIAAVIAERNHQDE
jgi:DNA-binding winged helix-turn-helix (wHTH) protein